MFDSLLQSSVTFKSCGDEGMQIRQNPVILSRIGSCTKRAFVL